MNGVRNEHGTPAYQSKPRARAASTNSRASIMRARCLGCLAAERGLRVREVDRALQVLQVVHAAPVAVHVQHLDGGTAGDQGVQELGHVELVEVLPPLELGE